MVCNRLKLSGMHNLGAGTNLNTASLLHHEHGGGAPGEEKAMICWQVRVSNKPKSINADLGSGAKKWALSLYLPDVKASIVKQISIEWERTHASSLLPEEVSIHWDSNQVLAPDTSTLTLSEFYAHHATPSMAYVLNKVPQVWKHHIKGNKILFCFEMYIDYRAWQLRTQINDEDMSCRKMIKSMTRSVSKRRQADTELENDRVSSSGKHHRLSGVGGLQSHFRLSSRTGPTLIHKRSQVVLKKIICSVVPDTGECEFEDTDEVITGLLRDSPFSSGSMKHAYDFQTSDGVPYVMKQFFRLRNEDPNDAVISVLENQVQIQAEITRLAVGQWFLDTFFKYAQSRGIDVDTKIAFADAFLAQELEKSSLVSGVGEIANGQEGLTWLVEKQRPTTVYRYSGTLAHPSYKRDKVSATIFAFVHFVYGHSGGQMVFADLQGTPTLIKGRDGLVLFDAMTHTMEEDSGVGDFGKEGIATFLRDHICGDVCLRLLLDVNVALGTPHDHGEKHTSQDDNGLDHDEDVGNQDIEGGSSDDE